MILQSLYRYYEILSKDPESDIALPGYSSIGVSFALNISAQGELLDVFPLFEQVNQGKKLVEKPRRMILPEQVKRSSNPISNFLWDNNAYVLGISDKDAVDPEYSHKRFEIFRDFNTELLLRTNSKASLALRAFLKAYDPSTGKEHPAITPYLESILKGGNLVFMFQGGYVHEDAQIRQVWEAYKAGKEAVIGQCLVTGEYSPIARIHPSIKGIRKAKSSGASLVSFNERAYESFNRVEEQGLNSPVSEKATFAYTTVLNYLLSSANPNKKFAIGDATVVYWAESERKEYACAFASLFEPEYVEEQTDFVQSERKKAEGRLKEIATKVRRIQALDVSQITNGLDENTRFYVLGLAPNSARVSIRFFLTEPFGKIVKRIMQHYEDLKIAKEFENQPTYITVGHILAETVSAKSSDKESSPLLSGAVMRAILSGSAYPSALYYAILNRVRVDTDDKTTRKINYIRAAVIKAFLIRKYQNQINHPFQEVFTMSLNEQSEIPAYLLGRLFAVLEKVQQEAIGDVNASIKDRYFTSACATPASVFPVLLRLSQHHISKAEYGYASDRRIQDIMNLLDVEKNPIPARLSLDEQGIFVLGYYHQRAAFFAPKKENANSNA
jgi:CRISPR-associated protein Csd1